MVCYHVGGPSKVPSLLYIFVLISLTCISCDAAGRSILDVTKDQGAAVSIPLDNVIGPGTESALRLDEPPLVRVVKDFEPEGLHLNFYGDGSILFSWQTGAEQLAPYDAPPTPYDPATVESAVQLGTKSGVYDKTVRQNCPQNSPQCPASQFKSLVYDYLYLPYTGGIAYSSPIIHHALVTNLTPGKRYFYRVGNPTNGWSKEYSFLVPSNTAKTIKIGVFGDIGQTANSSRTLEGILSKDTSLVLSMGDLTYADDHFSNATYDQTKANYFYYGPIKPPQQWTSDQRRWDAWARLMEPLLATRPMLTTFGNHDIERAGYNNDTKIAVAFNARYPQPQDPTKIKTDPMDVVNYISPTNINQFINSATAQPNNSYFSVAVPPLHIININSYLPYGDDSVQVAWFKEAVKKIDRKKTPWLIMTWHTASYMSYNNHFREADPLLATWEPLMKEAGVDVVMNGHCHAYERTQGVYNYTIDDCAPIYITVGDAGNIEGLFKYFEDTNPQPYCTPGGPAPPLPWYVPTPTGTFAPLTYPAAFNYSYCPQSQPPYSRFRNPAFGHGTFEVFNETHAEWTWFRTLPSASDVVDRAMIVKNRKCANQNKGVSPGAFNKIEPKTNCPSNEVCAPGLSENAPGQADGGAPGKSDNAPGQQKNPDTVRSYFLSISISIFHI